MVNFKVKWEGGKKYSHCNVMTGEEKELKGGKGKKGKVGDDNIPGSLTEGGKWFTVLALDCRGLEPTHYHPNPTDFTVTSEWGSVFEEDLTLGLEDWCEYCEKGNEPVGVNEFEWRFVNL